MTLDWFRMLRRAVTFLGEAILLTSSRLQPWMLGAPRTVRAHRPR